MHGRGKVELAAEKEDACAVVLEATEAGSGGFDGLDTGVEAFGHRIGDAMFEVIEQPDQVIGECAGRFLECLQT